ncbi:tellurite resistance protein [Ruegeria sp. TM1040]|nr:tellurite resistance protein [Ruegeria sp. TM1040]
MGTQVVFGAVSAVGLRWISARPAHSLADSLAIAGNQIPMPTAARLVAAVALALLAFVVSGQIMPLMPDDTDFGYFTFVNMGLGLVIGWKSIGPRAGRGWAAGITNGITGTAVLVLWGLFIQGAVEMFRLAKRSIYDGPFEALAAIFTIALEYFFIMAVPSVLLTLAVGGTLIGMAVEIASKRWK